MSLLVDSLSRQTPKRLLPSRAKLDMALLGSSAQEIPTPVCQPDAFDSIMTFMGGAQEPAELLVKAALQTAEEGRCLLNSVSEPRLVSTQN